MSSGLLEQCRRLRGIPPGAVRTRTVWRDYLNAITAGLRVLLRACRSTTLPFRSPNHARDCYDTTITDGGPGLGLLALGRQRCYAEGPLVPLPCRTHGGHQSRGARGE